MRLYGAGKWILERDSSKWIPSAADDIDLACNGRRHSIAAQPK